MNLESNNIPRIPAAPNSIQKGTPLKHLLGSEAVECLAHNISLVYPQFDAVAFSGAALDSLEPLGILDRGQKLAQALRQYLPGKYAAAIEILLASLTPPLTRTDELGLAVFFYLPHVCFVAEYGLEPEENDGEDPFEVSMEAQYQLTKRFSAEFSIRQFLIREQERTLSRLLEWTSDPDPHVRRLCSEGSRPRTALGSTNSCIHLESCSCTPNTRSSKRRSKSLCAPQCCEPSWRYCKRPS